MNRKNTILIAVLVNVGLLAVLLIAAITTQEELSIPSAPLMGDVSPRLPQFDEPSILSLHEAPPSATVPIEIPIATIEEPFKLPPLVPEVVAPSPVALAPPPALPAHPPGVTEVVVKKGDTLEKIAKANGTTVDEIIKINHLPSSFLKIGQALKIPAPSGLASLPKEVVKKVETGPEYYTMKVGENPWAIAMKHHMKVEELLRLNGLNEERARKLKPGDRLRIR